MNAKAPREPRYDRQGWVRFAPVRGVALFGSFWRGAWGIEGRQRLGGAEGSEKRSGRLCARMLPPLMGVLVRGWVEIGGYFGV